MELREKQICKVLEKFTRIRYNHLKRVVVEEKKLMSERPFREALKQVVEKGLVKKFEIDKQHVEYTVQFYDIEYEKEAIEYFTEIFSKYEKLLDNFMKKQEKKSKIDQADFIITFLKSVYLIEFRFKDFAYARKNPKIKSLRIQLQNVKDLAEAVATYDELDSDIPNSVIFETVNNMMMSESLEMLDELNQNLVQIK
ncbi:MAG: hypothetical protein IIC67_03040 [Thaumarchaeota archaeon]|nr:hypothetical protein [Nitrososphaerota archaeon]